MTAFVVIRNPHTFGYIVYLKIRTKSDISHMDVCLHRNYIESYTKTFARTCTSLCVWLY